MEWDFAQLAVFRSVIATGSFTNAAVALGVSQPAVSKQVADLELSLGVSLIERGRRGAKPTHAGEVLMEYAGQIDETLASAAAALSDLTGLRRGRLRIGATPTLGTYLLPRALVYFRARFPAIDVTVDVLPAATVAARLADGRLDVLLTARPPTGPRCVARQFMTDKVLAVCAPGHPLAARRRATLTTVAAERLLIRSGRHGTAGWVERMLRARKCEANAVLRLPQTEAVKQAALAGLGLAFLPGVAVADELTAGRLVSVSVASFTLARPYFWAERVLRVRPNTVRAFECVIKHAVRGSLPKVRGQDARPA